MPKYKLAVIATTFVEVEADDLDLAIKKIHKKKVDFPGIDMSKISSWELDKYHSIEKDSRTITYGDSVFFLCDKADYNEL